MRAYTRAYVERRRSCLYFCRRLRPAHTPTVAVKVQTCWTFKASADQRRHSSQSRKRSKVTEGRRVVLHRDVCGRIPTHTLACLYFYPRRNLRYAVAMRRQPQAWTSAPAAGAYARMEYKPGLYMHGFRWKFMAPSSSRARNSVMKIAERSSLKILPSPNTKNYNCPDMLIEIFQRFTYVTVGGTSSSLAYILALTRHLLSKSLGETSGWGVPGTKKNI